MLFFYILVGKSALTIQLIQKQFIEWYDPTIEESYIKNTNIDGKWCILDVLDTAGQEIYTAMREQHMRNGDAFLLVYSVADRATFENIAYFYSSILRVKNRAQVPMILVANKCDLANLRKVSKEEGHLLSNFLKIPYIETSAKNGINVDLAFHEAVRIIRYILFLKMVCLKIKKFVFILIEDNLHTT
jgi:small GTP-binding protein